MLSKNKKFKIIKIMRSNSKIDLETLKKNKIIKKSYSKIKILGSGNLKSKIDIEADYSSISAKDKIEKIGGVIKIKNPK